VAVSFGDDQVVFRPVFNAHSPDFNQTVFGAGQFLVTGGFTLGLQESDVSGLRIAPNVQSVCPDFEGALFQVHIASKRRLTAPTAEITLVSGDGHRLVTVFRQAPGGLHCDQDGKHSQQGECAAQKLGTG
jgi:hypothetical protein